MCYFAFCFFSELQTIIAPAPEHVKYFLKNINVSPEIYFNMEKNLEIRLQFLQFLYVIRASNIFYRAHVNIDDIIKIYTYISCR